MWMEEIGYNHNSEKHSRAEVFYHSVLEWRLTRAA